MKLLLVGQADSIFFEHYTKALKRKDQSIQIDVFSVDAINGKYDLSACDSVVINTWGKSIFRKVRYVRILLAPFCTRVSLHKYLKSQNKQYDVIHFKWLIPGVVLCPKLYLRYTKHIVATFWGQEADAHKLLYSSALYKRILISFLDYASGQIGSGNSKLVIQNRSKFYYGIYASSVLEHLHRLREKETKNSCKEEVGVSKHKISIAIGYSGKSLHRHAEILIALLDNEEFRKHLDKFCIVLQMNYGCSEVYAERIENLIKGFGIEYVLIRPSKLSDLEIAKLRIATDIMIQLSTSDGRSSSIIEALVAGTIMISGSWLPYAEFKEMGAHFYELDCIDDTLPELVLRLSDNFETESKKCQANIDVIPSPTWDSVITNWIDAYRAIMAK